MMKKSNELARPNGDCPNGPARASDDPDRDEETNCCWMDRLLYFPSCCRRIRRNQSRSSTCRSRCCGVAVDVAGDVGVILEDPGPPNWPHLNDRPDWLHFRTMTPRNCRDLQELFFFFFHFKNLIK